MVIKHAVSIELDYILAHIDNLKILLLALTHDASPFDFFSLFFDDAVLKMVIDGTNSYASDVIAEKERNGKLTQRSRWKNWRPVTIDEVKQFWLSLSI